MAEPVTGVYLVETLSWLSGGSFDQRLVSISDMMDWQFFDEAEWMNATYKNSTSQDWELARSPSTEGQP